MTAAARVRDERAPRLFEDGMVDGGMKKMY